MLFSSTIFIFVFLPVVLLIYYLIHSKVKNLFLLISSLLFYAYGEPKFVYIMIASIIINYLMGILIDFVSYRKNYIKRIVLSVALLCNIGLLVYFKYFDFLIENINNLFNQNFDLFGIILPIGISFFTFQGMSYLIDLHFKKYKVQKNPINLGLYIALFPQLIAGPIVRYIDVNEQIIGRKHTLDKFAEGVRRFVIGLAKKIIIANTFALLADSVFDNNVNELVLSWIGILSYTIQIYFDFSGYSDMAIGLGKMFGFDFLENFNYPYISTSITDFWRRWHISLSSWFRDYVYIPLGGNRKGNMYFNLLVVFIVTGLWHGAAWTFILWGIWHGFFLIFEKLHKKSKIKIHFSIKWIYTFLIVILGWVLFRSPSLVFAVDYIITMFDFTNINPDLNTFIMIRENIIMFVLAIIFATPIFKIVKNKFNNFAIYKYLETITILALFVVSISYIVTSQYNPFIYFNF